jgi:hypothetical protein
MYRKIILLFFCIFLTVNARESVNLIELAGFRETKSDNLSLQGVGTGFAITKDGYIVTASHVTKECDYVRVLFKGGQTTEARVVKEEHDLDVAILKVDFPTPDFLHVSDNTSRLGDEVYTIGYPSPQILGKNQKYTEGSVSAISGIRDRSLHYQVSIPVQPGNSGGPMVCEETGDVTGIIVGKLNEEIGGFDAQNVNYALKSTFIRPVLEVLEIQMHNHKGEIKEDKKAKRRRVINSLCMVVTCKKKEAFENDHKKKGNPKNKNPVEKDDSFVSNFNPLNKVYSWTDLKGRVIEAFFVKLESENLHLIFQNKPFIVNIKSLTVASRNKAQELNEILKFGKNLGGSNQTEFGTGIDTTEKATLTIRIPNNNGFGSFGYTIGSGLGSYSYSVTLDGRFLGKISSSQTSGTFTLDASGIRRIQVSIDSRPLLGLGKTSKVLHTQDINLTQGHHEIIVTTAY